MPSSLHRPVLIAALTLLLGGMAQAEPQYTGIIIDARGLAVDRVMAPSLISENGAVIYPVLDPEKPLDIQAMIRDGMAVYATSIEEAWQLKRLGGMPLVVKAEDVEESGDIILDEADAQRILTANYTAKFLENQAVAIVH
jgi:hypothetical protein